MPFDTETRSKLAKLVKDARETLAFEFTAQLQEKYGIHPDGTIMGLATLSHLDDGERAVAELLRERIEHLASSMVGEKNPEAAAIDRLTREQAFTVLNRFAALRMCEERGLVQECVRQGMNSRGFQVYLKIAGSCLGEHYDRYRTYLNCICDEIAVDLGILFDRFSPFGLLFPREPALISLLEIINRKELKHVWVEDETIGWVYQYFNPPEERKAMRDASQAPRNSRELAVRNQFFTPRYVVEFLTDNTLGRIWYEMRKGETILKEQCRYLVRRPNEIFLASEEKSPNSECNNADLTQEELLKKPVYIGHRSKKDPRDIRILDPACGSGHFLLYAFDLLERIYEEAWSDPESPKSDVTDRTLSEDFEKLDDLRRETPKLIVEHNLHGIDIDPRAVQIAALALWLRAQKRWKNLGLKAEGRPNIVKSNIVTAEPMPGEEDMRREFTAGLHPRVLGQIVDEVFEKMKLAGEAGSLLRIEEEIKDAVGAAREQWSERPKPEQQYLPGMVNQQPKQQELRFDVKGITDEGFWWQAEDHILEALKDYAEQAENGRAVRRRLFVEDIARGFAFIDLCRKRYDVVLMNPPFGLAPTSAFEYARGAFPNSYTELLATFVERGSIFSSSKIGAITSRAFMVATRLDGWRKETVIGQACLLADLGENVMDGAFVEAAAYVLDKTGLQSLIALDFRKRHLSENDLFEACHFLNTANTYLTDSSLFLSFPRNRIAYSVGSRISSLLKSKDRFEPSAGTARQGLATWDDFRLVRAFWEVHASNIGITKLWEYLAKGGPFSRYLSNVHLLMNWNKDGKESRAINIAKNGTDAQARQAFDYWHRPGLTYSIRSQRGFSARVLPKGCLFTGQGPLIVSESEISNAYLLGWINSSLIRTIIEMQSNDGKFMSGLIKSIPWREPIKKHIRELEYETRRSCINLLKLESTADITSPYFCSIVIRDSISEICRTASAQAQSLGAEITQLDALWDDYVSDLYNIGKDTVKTLRDQNAFESHDISSDPDDCEEAPIDAGLICRNLLEYLIGITFSRWDVRIAFDPSLAPKLPDPFDPLPACPPGMLVGMDGLPAEPNSIVSEEWLRARPDANTLPPDGSVKTLTIPDSKYPLRISWDGVLVDDPGSNVDQPHRENIVRRLQEVFDLVWKDKAHKIEQEACDILGVSDLCYYFSKPAGFFQEHLKRYSKSRRKAPIYWPLSTESGSYTLWIYYHRLTDQTLYTCIQDYVEPKIKDVTLDLEGIQKELQSGITAKKREQYEQLTVLRQELIDFRDELLRIAKLPYKPNLNDGVMITACPLWKLFRHNQWRKDLKTCWEELEAGTYDWAHLAYTIWPDRVREKCKKDRSLAIAHGLEEICEVKETTKTKTRKKKKGEAEA